MRLYGIDHYNALRVAVSPDGKHVYATVGNEMFYMSGVAHDGGWKAIPGGFKQVQVGDNGILYGVDQYNNAFKRDPGSLKSTFLKGGKNKRFVAANGLGNLIFALDEGTNAASLFRFSTGHWVGAVNTQFVSRTQGFWNFALNYAGSIFAGCSAAHHSQLWGLYRTNYNGFTEFSNFYHIPLPAGVDGCLNVAIGNFDDLWLVDRKYKLHRGKMGMISGQQTATTFNWEVLEGMRVSQVAVTKDGQVYGVTLDGHGILHCPKDNPATDFESRCEYLHGPKGTIPDTSYDFDIL
ncbi:expressed unknown protein [Seminavis robusta]|uniref:Uncharacterized protein n=1 Tax=Seminavis robusta TaxID=568900 RepID=A0A9N8EMF2_9STRA|nr:expressed unknown protein [Seminavis robusta]|eukprot:Sro1459_g274520.1 n/a (293) ;mRNA; f:17219-18456